MGLIDKAIKKTEEKEERPAQKEISPEPGRKRGTFVALAALLMVSVLLTGGYFYVTKQNQEPPRKMARRAESARERLQRQKTETSGQRQDTSTTAGIAEQTETTPAGALTQSAATQQEQKDLNMPPDQAQISSIPQAASPFTDHESEISNVKEELEGGEAAAPESSEPPLSPTLDQEEKTLLGRYLPEGDREDVAGLTQEETFWPETQEFPEEDYRPSYVTDFGEQAPLTVKDTSALRAQKYFDKGTVYQKDGSYEKAIESYTKALTFNPDHLQARVNLATAYLQTGRFKEAEQELVYLYALKPNDCVVLYNFGLLLYNTGELFSAETKLKRLLELDPLHLEAHLLLGSVYEEKRDINQALKLYMKAYRINSADPGVLYRLGRVCDIKGELAEAVKYYRSFLNAPREKERGLTIAVRDRLNYLVSQKEGKDE